MPSIQRILSICMMPVLAGGCVISGPGMEDMVDTELHTGSIAAAAPVEPDQLSDQRTVRNAVSAADISRSAGDPLPWANADTGASGVISRIEEMRDGDRICRSFTTSRQRFDGIALYNGEACTKGEGEWTLIRFSENG